ncbi:hypothetical protein SDC9_120704 [bioreactor metagenome]|uniref:Uncharacterized protein n=1 Tax=bioreactor metagenome TaxID=1076179 RepID=A0A645C9Y8_9ZZZZ
MYEDDVKAAFVQAMSGMIAGKDDLISEYKQIIRRLTDHAALNLEAKQQTDEADVVSELIRKCVAENAANSQDQEAYLERYKGLKVRYEVAAQRQNRSRINARSANSADRRCWSLFRCWNRPMGC